MTAPPHEQTHATAPIRITLVTPGFRDDPGGVEVHTSELVRDMHALGATLDVVTARRRLRRREQHWFGDCQVTVYPAWNIQAMAIAPRAVLGAVRDHVHSDVLHVHSYHATTGLAVLFSRRPTVFTPHYHGIVGHSPLARMLHPFYRYLGRLILARSDAIICVSRAEHELLVRDFPVAADKVEVIPNGVRVEELRQAQPLPIPEPVVLCVGRLEPYKGFADVVRAFRHVPPPARLVIIGDGSQRDELQRLACEYGLQDRIFILGRLSDAELRRWFRTAKILVSMSVHEAFGMVPLEAAAAGARVILSDIPAHREIVADFLTATGVIVTPGDFRALATEISKQLDAAGPCETENIPTWSAAAARTTQIYSRLRSGLRTTYPATSPPAPNRRS
ncbi:glycosyltransferase family 4 protein [Mycobacterium sp. PDNC021]|uniref:glycosyltransferase family 4 protein n=1 Tax=Mycobacterium sp. PDNC021 TaxID=3391399 RepID=UPI003AAE8F47